MHKIQVVIVLAFLNLLPSGVVQADGAPQDTQAPQAAEQQVQSLGELVLLSQKLGLLKRLKLIRQELDEDFDLPAWVSVGQEERRELKKEADEIRERLRQINEDLRRLQVEALRPRPVTPEDLHLALTPASNQNLVKPSEPAAAAPQVDPVRTPYLLEREVCAPR